MRVLACRSSVISLIMRFYDVNGGAVRGRNSTFCNLGRGYSTFDICGIVLTLPWIMIYQSRIRLCRRQAEDALAMRSRGCSL